MNTTTADRARIESELATLYALALPGWREQTPGTVAEKIQWVLGDAQAEPTPAMILWHASRLVNRGAALGNSAGDACYIWHCPERARESFGRLAKLLGEELRCKFDGNGNLDYVWGGPFDTWQIA